MRALRRRALALVGLLVACGKPYVSPDSGAPDAAVTDVVADAAPPDAEVVRDWPGYRRIPPLCGDRTDVADDLGAALPEWRWTDCSGIGATGCQRLVLDEDPVTWMQVSPGPAADRLIHIARRRSDGYESQVYTLTGVRKFGLRTAHDECSMQSFVGLGGVGSFRSYRARGMVAWVPTAALGPTIPWLELPPNPKSAPWDSVVAQATSPQAMAFSYGGSIFRLYDFERRMVVEPLPPPGIALNPRAFVGRDAWPTGVNTSGERALYLLNADGVASMRVRAGGHILAVGADATTLAWVEGWGGPLSDYYMDNNELWYAPYTTDLATLTKTAKRRMVLPKPSLGSALTVDGLVALSGPGTKGGRINRMIVVRLSDGASQAFDLGDRDVAAMGTFYMNELWIAVSEGPLVGYVARLPLGPWTPP